MFQSVRPNSQIYVLHKGDNPRLEIGYVVQQPVVKPKYPIPPALGKPQEFTVDLVVKLNSGNVNYQGLPADQDISDSVSNGEMITIADSREAMNAEILNAKQKSVDTLNSIEYHKQFINNCDRILSELNPEYAEKQQQKEEIDVLKACVSDMSGKLDLLLKQFSKDNKQYEDVGNQRK